MLLPFIVFSTPEASVSNGANQKGMIRQSQAAALEAFLIMNFLKSSPRIPFFAAASNSSFNKVTARAPLARCLVVYEKLAALRAAFKYCIDRNCQEQ